MVAAHNRLTHQGFVDKCRLLHGDKYDYSLAEYKGMRKQKITVVCPRHGKFNTLPITHVTSKHGCPECAAEHSAELRMASRDHFLQLAKNMHGDKYNYTKVDYRGMSRYVTIVCPEHGGFRQKAGAHVQGSGCRDCGYETVGDKKRLSRKQLIEDFTDIHGRRYDYGRVKYKNAHEHVVIICPEHGEFSQSPHHHKKGKGCPLCANVSNGEEKIAMVLDSLGVSYEREARFDECRNKRPLPFDFFIPTQIGGLLIEYDGIQHYNEDRGWGGEREFERITHRDSIKTEFAEGSIYNFIRIPYWDQEKIEEIITNGVMNGSKGIFDNQ